VNPEEATGVTSALGADAAEIPTALVAVTLNVYAVPLARPVTVAVVAPVVVALFPPGLAVTVYPVIGDPPSLAGAAQDTTAWASPGVAVTPVGAVGTVDAGAVGMTPVNGSDAGEVPAALVAVIVNV
jgi:hypothetical protein